jgi:hypothetical protein
MANPTNIPPAVVKLLEPSSLYDTTRASQLPEGGIVADPDTVFVHINDWAFLNGYAFVKLSSSAKGRRFRYACIFHSRKLGQRTQNTRKIEEKTGLLLCLAFLFFPRFHTQFDLKRSG